MRDPTIMICKDCGVQVEDYNHESHFRCPKCKKVLFQDTGEGELKIEEARDRCIVCQGGLNEYICDDCRTMISGLAKAFRIVINED